MDKTFPPSTINNEDSSTLLSKGHTLTGWSSVAVHSGHKQDPNYAHLVPIYASSTFVYDEAEQGMRRFSGKEQGYIYSRWGNPTFTEAENKIAALKLSELNTMDLPYKPKALFMHQVWLPSQR